MDYLNTARRDCPTSDRELTRRVREADPTASASRVADLVYLASVSLGIATGTVRHLLAVEHSYL